MIKTHEQRLTRVLHGITGTAEGWSLSISPLKDWHEVAIRGPQGAHTYRTNTTGLTDPDEIYQLLRHAVSMVSTDPKSMLAARWLQVARAVRLDQLSAAVELAMDLTIELVGMMETRTPDDAEKAITDQQKRRPNESEKEFEERRGPLGPDEWCRRLKILPTVGVAKYVGERIKEHVETLSPIAWCRRMGVPEELIAKPKSQVIHGAKVKMKIGGEDVGDVGISDIVSGIVDRHHPHDHLIQHIIASSQNTTLGHLPNATWLDAQTRRRLAEAIAEANNGKRVLLVAPTVGRARELTRAARAMAVAAGLEGSRNRITSRAAGTQPPTGSRADFVLYDDVNVAGYTGHEAIPPSLDRLRDVGTLDMSGTPLTRKIFDDMARSVADQHLEEPDPFPVGRLAPGGAGSASAPTAWPSYQTRHPAESDDDTQ